MAHLARFAVREAGGVRCTLCPHACLIREGHEGLCKVRGVRDGRLLSLVYGRPASVVSDEIEKKPFFHFHPGTRALSLGTLGCNVLCSGCQNWQISHAGAAGGEADRLAPLSPRKALAMAQRFRLQGVVWTYNEPAVWLEYVHDVATVFRRAGLYTALVTAGYMSAESFDYVAPLLDAVKVDLKAPSAEGWAWLTKVKDPQPVFGLAVRALHVHGCHVEVVSNLIPGFNTDDESVVAMATWIRDNLGPRVPWHVTRFTPNFELSYLTPTPLAVLEKAAVLGRKTGLHFVYVGNVPGHSSRHTVCPSCSRTVIHREEIGATEVRVKNGRCVFCGEDLMVVGC